jgi:serine/threonine protein kinase
MLTDTNKAIQGQQQSWNLIKKLGEGDAGEVYLVESLLDKQLAIVKRPRRGAFFTDILRQARQIKTEGSILRNFPRAVLQTQSPPLKIPTLIDQNKSEFELGEQTFIIIEEARGFDLKLLSQIIRFGPASVQNRPASPDYEYLIQQWAQFEKFPAPLLVRILLGVLNLLERIQSTEIYHEKDIPSGIIWNDVKPEHLYWDPMTTSLTVIDWGNAQFLEKDGVTRDRQYSVLDDSRQFIQEMGSFIAEANSDLYDQLEWPKDLASNEMVLHGIRLLKNKLVEIYEIDSEQLKGLRRQEADLYSQSLIDMEQLDQYSLVQRQLATFGEMPDPFNANNFMFKAAYRKASEFKLAEFQEVCNRATWLTSDQVGRWNLLNEIASLARLCGDQDGNNRTRFSNALTAGLAGDWPAALWELFAYMGNDPRPDWWEKISQEVRKVYLGLEAEAIAPYTFLARLYYTLRSEVTRKGTEQLKVFPEKNSANAGKADGFNWQANEELMAMFREEIINKWKESEPNPPNSGIGYSAVDGLMDPIEELLPGSREKIEKSLIQPRAQVDLVLKAWDQKDFELARRGLRLILVWDPDQARLLTAEKAIDSASEWLARVRRGAGSDEPFYDYLTSVELAGRTLRNQVGPASWLDKTLEVLKRLRKGTRSVDLMIEYPEITHEIPWLSEYQSREILSLPNTRALTIERDTVTHAPGSLWKGVVEGKFGPNQSMTFGEALDTWLPEARGSSARVFAGTMRKISKPAQSLAYKIMRPDQLEYALPLFIEEIKILTILCDIPGITPLVELGFLKIDDGQALPSDESHASAGELSGQVIHYGLEETQNYLAGMDRQLANGWLPYLTLIRRNPESNLIRYCDSSYTHGWFLTLRECLILALQLCDTLQFAHDRNIVYRDHKILHYYWDIDTHGVSMIDWNIAKHHPQGISEADKQFDLVQFGARALHHIFTGRPAQGSLPLGPNRAEEIDEASTHYPVTWTYDDERLPNPLRTILEQALNQEYTQVRDIRQGLLTIYQQLPGSNQN